MERDRGREPGGMMVGDVREEEELESSKGGGGRNEERKFCNDF